MLLCVMQMMLSSHDMTPAHTTSCIFDSGAADALAAALQVSRPLFEALDGCRRLLASCIFDAVAEAAVALPDNPPTAPCMACHCLPCKQF